MIQIIGIALAIAFLIVGALKGFSAILLAVVSSFIVIVFNGMNVWGAFSTNFVGGFVGAYSAFLLILIAAFCYNNVMQQSGSISAICISLMNKFGKKNVVFVCAAMAGVLGYGGVNALVICFAMAPVLFYMFREADLPRHFMMAPAVFGCATWTLGNMPASTQLNNVIPTQYLGTSLTAAPVLGLVTAAAIVVLSLLYMHIEEKRCRAKGEHWEVPANIDISKYELMAESDIPAAGKAFTPIIVLIVAVIAGSVAGLNSTMVTVCSLLIAALVCALLNMEKLKGTSFSSFLGESFLKAITSLASLGAILGFGAVVSASAGFQTILNWILELNASIYWKAIISTSLISGVVGSASSGSKLCLTYLGDYFIQSGANLNVIHRLVSMAGNTFDSLPNCPSLFVMMGALGLTHKESYKHFFWLSVVITSIVTICAGIVVNMIY